MSSPANHFWNLLALAQTTTDEENARVTGLNGSREEPNEWGPRARDRELQLRCLRDGCLRQAHRTNFPTPTVVQRVNDLVEPVIDILHWQGRCQRKTVTWQDPASVYLVEQTNRMDKAGRLVRDLAVIADVASEVDPTSTEPPDPTQAGAGAPAGEGFDQYVTLDQAAALVNRTKKTLERYLNEPKYRHHKMPQADVEGGGGKPHEWKWSALRPWLVKVFGKQLPERLPSLAARPAC